jgi:signal transduction histidine kinase
MEWWMVSTALNIVVVSAYLAISLTILRGLKKAGRVWSNPLMLATSAIFFTCAVHHGSHPVHMLLPTFGVEDHHSMAMREAFDSWHTSLWDVATAGVGIWYFMLRNRFPALARGSALFEDLRERERQALEIHDNVVQGLAEAQLAFDVGREQQAREAVDRTLAAARQIITDLLGEPGSGIELGPGDLRRSAPADQPFTER